MAPILDQIEEWPAGQPGWNSMTRAMLNRLNAMPEIMLDVLAQKLQQGSGIAINYNSVTKAFTIAGTGAEGLDVEAMMDYLASNLTVGGLSGTYDDPAGTLDMPGGAGGSTDAEVVRDTIGTALAVVGPLTKTVDDPGDTITLSIVPRVVALTDGATITPNCDTTDIGTVTIAGNRTFAAPSGTPVAGQKLIFRIKQDATGSRVPTWNAIYRFPGGTATTLTTAANKTDYVGFIYNATDTKWDNVAVTKNL